MIIVGARHPGPHAWRNTHRPHGWQQPTLSYALVTLFGIAIAMRIFPPAALDGTLSLVHPAFGDTAQHIAGQRFFIADQWRWPLLTTTLVDPPIGTDIALTDSIPLAALAGRVLSAALPAGGHLIYAWVALCFAVQPIAGLFAARSAGLRGVVLPVAVAVLAACMPAMVFRFNHAALCAHFLLLIAIGLYFRLTAPGHDRWFVPAALLMVASLLVHPYLMAMVVGLLWAAPLTLAIRRSIVDTMRVIVGLAIATGLLAGCAVAGGYLAAGRATGFGYYSLNLLSPFVPTGSALIGGFAMTDATGGQFEGYSYLGLGLMAVAGLAAIALVQRGARLWLATHAGLVVAAAGAMVFAASDTVYAGTHLLFHMPIFPDALKQLRASGRFVWVDLYVLAIVGATMIRIAIGPRAAAALLATLALLQFADTRTLRGQVAGQLRQPAAWAIDPGAYRPIFAAHRQLTLWPTASCNPGLVSDSVFMHTILLASEVALPVNTIPTARATGTAGCDSAVLTRPDLGPGELRLLLPGVSANLLTSLPGLAGQCHALPGGLVGCSHDPSVARYPVITAATFPVGTALFLGEPGGAALAGLGWTTASPDGAWTIGGQATLLGAPAATGPLRLSIVAHGLALPGLPQTVHVLANGQPIAEWAVSQGADASYDAAIPAAVLTGGTLTITLGIAAPVAPNDVMGNGDQRLLGLFLRSFRLDPT